MATSPYLDRSVRVTEEELETLVRYEKDPNRPVATIVFNRPEKKNSLPVDAFGRIADLVTEAEVDPSVRVIVLKGAGEDFGTGIDAADLGRFAGMGDGKPGEKRATQGQRLRALRQLREWQNVLINCTKVTIAQVQGYCYDAHLQLACQCDFLISADNALFGAATWRYLGTMADFAMLTELIGLRKMQDITLSGRPLDANEAAKCRLATSVVPVAELQQEVDDYIAAVVTRPADGIAVGKTTMNASMHSRGLWYDDISARTNQPFLTNIVFEEGEANFLKLRRDVGLKAALQSMKDRDMQLPPRFRLSREARRGVATSGRRPAGGR